MGRLLNSVVRKNELPKLVCMVHDDLFFQSKLERVLDVDVCEQDCEGSFFKARTNAGCRFQQLPARCRHRLDLIGYKLFDVQVLKATIPLFLVPKPLVFPRLTSRLGNKDSL